MKTLRRAVPGRLYRDTNGTFWIGGEDRAYWQASRNGRVLKAAGHRLNDPAVRIHPVSITTETPRTSQAISRSRKR